MKILIVRTFPTYFDIKKNTYNIQEIGLAKALVRKGQICDIVLWTCFEEKDEIIEIQNGRLINVFYRHGKVLLKNVIFSGLQSLIDKYDIIQCAEHNQIQSWLYAKKYPANTVVYHGPYFSTFNKRYNVMCRITDFLVLPTYRKLKTPFLVKSELAKGFLLERGISSEHITVVGVGLDVDAVSAVKGNNIPQELLKIRDFCDRIRLLYIGRIEPRRNIPFLFEIVGKLGERKIPAELILIGDGDAEYRNQCLKAADRMGVRDHIYWIEKAEQKHLSFVYENSDVFLLPTYYEIFGMVLLEAMYYGKPVITTINGGSEMLIENGKDGIIMGEFDAEKWCDAVLDVKDNKGISKAARKRIIERFTWDGLSDKFLEVYRKRKGKQYGY